MAIVTGAARGIGKAIAMALVKKALQWFYRMLMDEVHKTAEEIRQAGGQAVSIVGNVTKMEDCEAMVD